MTHDETDETAGGSGAATVARTGGDRTLDAPSRTSIESRLRSMYDEVAAEPVPDRFLDLLNKLERSEASAGGEGEGSDAR